MQKELTQFVICITLFVLAIMPSLTKNTKMQLATFPFLPLEKAIYHSSTIGKFTDKVTNREINFVTHRFMRDGVNIAVSDPVRGRDVNSLASQFEQGKAYDLTISKYEYDGKTFSAKAGLVSAVVAGF